MSKKPIAGIQALCHDQRSMLAGAIRGVDDRGCEFLGPSEGDTPVFPKKTLVILNLIDEASGKTQNLQVRLGGVSRREGRWSYRLQWEETPEILAPHAARGRSAA